MTKGFLELMKDWSGLGVVTHYDRQTDSWMFVALHDNGRGMPLGGSRLKVYDRPEDGLVDAMRLAEGMTYKWASIDFEYGGGKAVLALSHDLDRAEREGLLRRYAHLLNALNGSFGTGEDLGTTPEDMLFLARESKFVHGANPATGEAKDPGPYTALGVLCGIRAAVKHVFKVDDLRGRIVLVQGVGDVGAPLAQQAAADGARLVLSDVDEARVQKLAAEIGGTVVSPEAVYSTGCDVFAPCAVGATLNRKTIPQLKCRIVAGSANNQLEVPEDAERLHGRGILYAPDYVVNAGGAMAFGSMAAGIDDPDEIQRRVRSLGDALLEIFREASSRNESPLHAAQRRVERVLKRNSD